MIKPKALKKGDTIGLIAPSGAVKAKDTALEAINILEAQGFKVKAEDSCFERYGYLSGSDELRAADLNKMFKDEEVKGVFCLRGGYGTPRILDRIDYEMIKKNPKVFIGYSDITAIHIALNRFCKLVTFHGPMAASDMVGGFDEFSKASYLKAIMESEPLGELTNPESFEIKTLVGGKASGQIVGGNLSLIAGTLGTPYEINTKGKILFIEDISEYTYSVDRMLTELRLSGKLEECSGIIIGDFKECEPQYENFDHTLIQVFEDIIKPLGKPTIYNFRAGHCTPKITIPLGAEAEIDGDNCKVTVLESALEE
ncbi:LD-carboxypeptidase [Clostridium sp. 19966]|uniref:S66 peptidase family protein n=1 Tax=Clostridium sp. 19966 TaxID=2768166 RepID=UPI0028DD9B69|nr:LD-carboxypeptidase [Clostridium sp. 19966]MDT8719618.1 LD-carboxypeptidase [Clostridium sp. 19966]